MLVRRLIRKHDKASIREAKREAREAEQQKFAGRVESIIAMMQPTHKDQWAIKQ